MPMVGPTLKRMAVRRKPGCANFLNCRLVFRITAIPILLDMLDVHGCLVTIDALGCQTAIADQIVAQEADYVLACKGNQERLHTDVEELFITLLSAEQPSGVLDYVK